MISFYLPLAVMITVYFKILLVVRSQNRAITLQVGQIKEMEDGKSGVEVFTRKYFIKLRVT
jgi:hypothetical protein